MTEALCEFLKTLRPKATLLDQDRAALAQTLRELIDLAKRSSSDGRPLLSNDELEETFAASATLGWTLWQHLASIEILSRSGDWCGQNPELWRRISGSDVLVGLAVTHTNRDDPRFVQAGFQEHVLVLNGLAPWASGLGVFEKGIVGYRLSSGQIGMAVFDFPGQKAIRGIDFEFIDLAVFNGSASARLDFRTHSIPTTSIVSGPRAENEKIVSQFAPSIYLAPELGLARSAVHDLEELNQESSIPAKKSAIDEMIRSLSTKIAVVAERRRTLLANPSRTKEDEEDLRFAAYQVIRTSAQAVGLFCGGKGLRAGSPVARRYLEIQLLDVTYQSPRMLAKKLGLVLGTN